MGIVVGIVGDDIKNQNYNVSDLKMQSQDPESVDTIDEVFVLLSSELTKVRGNSEALKQLYHKFRSLTRFPRLEITTEDEQLFDAEQIIIILLHKISDAFGNCSQPRDRARLINKVPLKNLPKSIRMFYAEPNAKEKVAFLNSVVYFFDFASMDIDRASREIDLLRTLVAQPDIVEMIDLPTYCQTSERAYSFLSKLLTKEDAHLTLANAYGLLDIDEQSFQGSEHEPTFDTSEVIKHLSELLPQKVLLYGSCHIVGYSCYGGLMALSECLFPQDLLPQSEEFWRAILLLVCTILHEMAHLKKIKYYSKKYKKPTPPRFDKESGKYFERVLLGNATLVRDYPWRIPQDALQAFFKFDTWKSPQFLDAYKLIELSDVSSPSKGFTIHEKPELPDHTKKESMAEMIVEPNVKKFELNCDF